jgi:hypothetical protein
MAADVDAELATALKQAKSKEMFFCFIQKGTEGTLLVSKRKIPPKQIAEARKELGGGKPISGKCMGPPGGMQFKVAKEVSPSLATIMKKVIKNTAGIMVAPEFVVDEEVEPGEEEGGGVEAPETAAAGVAAAASPEQAEAEAAEALDDSTDEDPDLGAWHTARNNAINELRTLASKVLQEAGKNKDNKDSKKIVDSVKGVVKEINTIIARLPENPKRHEIDKLKEFIRDEDTITAAEESPDHFHKLRIRKPMLEALESLRQ